MTNSPENSIGLETVLFIDQMNEYYYNPREIEYRIPKNLAHQPLLDIILSMRERKADPIYLLTDQKGHPFRLWKTPTLEKLVYKIDEQRSDWKKTEPPKAVLEELLIRSLIDEAYYSSWIEGAKTTHRRAEEIVRKKKKPMNRSESMTLNNFRAMKFIIENLSREVDQNFVCELQKIVTANTLDPEVASFAGQYRNDWVYIYDQNKNKIEYTPPPHKNVPELMGKLFDWINYSETIDTLFLHPVIKASLIHFYTVYVHPFFDGNGRTARALMYYDLLKHGYDFMQFFSISKAIAAKRKPYYQAILNVENYQSDLTYFVLFTAQMILEAISTVETEKEKEESLRKWFEKIKESGVELNKRQEKLIKRHFRESVFPITIHQYRRLFKKIVYQTARTDLLDLVEAGLLKKSKRGKEFVFDLKLEKG